MSHYPRAIGAGIEPEPDTLQLCRPEGSASTALAIFDAKYKEIAPSNPGAIQLRSGTSEDHYKQYVYRRLLEEAGQRPRLNILVFPKLFLDSTEGQPYIILGRHNWGPLTDSEVWEIGLNYRFAVEAFLGERSLNREELTAGLMRELR